MTETKPEIKLYNTRTRSKEVFAPIDPDNVRMYVCGPTVYDRAHIGNARPVVVFDVLYRLLRHVYGDDAVTYVRNFTDVDDRIIEKAVATKGADETLEAATRRITDETISWYHEDMDALGALRPDHEPRCTDPRMMTAMVAMSQELIDKGYAYAAEGHVLFSVEAYEKYGSLSGRSVDDMIAGARVEVAPYKKNPMDFVIWKPSTDEQPGWESPWGRGRPGWHIECSAMAKELLGEVFDIHAGGIDLAFPHHENELAQSCCVHGTDRMANWWMHNEMLRVEGEKMSKSLGNFFTVRDLLENDHPGPVVRYVLLRTHYRQALDWTEDRVSEAYNALRKWSSAATGGGISNANSSFLLHLSDDLNVSESFAVLNELFEQDRRDELVASAALLGFNLPEIASSSWAKHFEYEAPDGSYLKEGVDYQPNVSVLGWGKISEELRDASLRLVHRWLMHRRNKDWQNADCLRASAAGLGVQLRATRSPNGINGGQASLSGKVKPHELEALR